MNFQRSKSRFVVAAVLAAFIAGGASAAILAPRGGAATNAQKSAAVRAVASDPVPAGWYSSSIAQQYRATGPGVVADTAHGMRIVLVPTASGGQCVLGISGSAGQEAIRSTCSDAATLAASGGQPFVLGTPDGSAVRGAALPSGVGATGASVGATPQMTGRVALIPDSSPNEDLTIQTASGRSISIPAFPH